MDYYKIGQRVRQYRRDRALSQEELAEKAGISVTHMSHIETGNTKLSLPVLVSLCQALKVQADELLSDAPQGRAASLAGLEAVLETCTPRQLCIIKEIVLSAKRALDRCDQEK